MPSFLVALLYFLISPVYSDFVHVDLHNCHGDPFSQMVMCTPKMEELEAKLAITTFMKPGELVKTEISKLCDDTLKCLDPLKCSEARRARDVLETGCQNLLLGNGEFLKCVKSVYAAVYNGKLACSKEHHFLSKTPSEKIDAFQNGASCFHEMVQSECSEQISALWKNESIYDKVVNILTVNPNRESCQNLYYFAEGLKCEPMGHDIHARTTQINFRTVKRNDKELVELVNVCREAKNCMKESCVFREEQRVQADKGCQLIELAGTDFFQCIQKLTNEQPEGLRMLECFKEHDLNSKNKTVKCGFFKEHKECLKVAMKAFCGDGALENFDENSRILRSTFKCEN